MRCGKYCTAGEATGDNMAYPHCILNNNGYKHTLRICSTYCFSTATTVTRKRLNVTLHIHCLSCLYYYFMSFLLYSFFYLKHWFDLYKPDLQKYFMCSIVEVIYVSCLDLTSTTQISKNILCSIVKVIYVSCLDLTSTTKISKNILCSLVKVIYISCLDLTSTTQISKNILYIQL
jgi:hypothetical protein